MERDQQAYEVIQKEQTQLETRAVRYSVLAEFLQAKVRHENNIARWKVVCADNINVRVNTNGNCNMANGLAQTIMTPWMPISLLQNGIRTDRSSLLLDGNICVVDWICTSNPSIGGTIKARFDPTSNKIVHVDLVICGACNV